MFIIELVYTASLADIDRHMASHMAFVHKYYAAGNFVVSGRKIPRDGGIILAVGESRAIMPSLMSTTTVVRSVTARRLGCSGG